MSEITKRFLTSVILFIILILSIYSKIILSIIFKQTIENTIKNIEIIQKKKNIIYNLSIFIININIKQNYITNNII